MSSTRSAAPRQATNPTTEYPLHEITRNYADFTPAELAALREDIRHYGQRLPVTIWQGQLVEGRHRAMVCAELGLKLITHDISEMTEEAMRAYVKSLNHHRRSRTAPLTNEEKRARVEAALKTDPAQSDRAIAEQTGVTQPFVSGIRKDLVVKGVITVITPTERRSRTGKTGQGARRITPDEAPRRFRPSTSRPAKKTKGLEAGHTESSTKEPPPAVPHRTSELSTASTTVESATGGETDLAESERRESDHEAAKPRAAGVDGSLKPPVLQTGPVLGAKLIEPAPALSDKPQIQAAESVPDELTAMRTEVAALRAALATKLTECEYDFVNTLWALHGLMLIGELTEKNLPALIEAKPPFDHPGLIELSKAIMDLGGAWKLREHRKPTQNGVSPPINDLDRIPPFMDRRPGADVNADNTGTCGERRNTNGVDTR
jgi:hypothetical protein